MKKTISILLVTAALAGCAAVQQDYDQTFCTPDAAYQNGMKDARAGKPMQANYAVRCSAAINHYKINRDYRQGYRFAARRIAHKKH